MTDWLDSEEFAEAMREYRFADDLNRPLAQPAAFENVKRLIRKHMGMQVTSFHIDRALTHDEMVKMTGGKHER